ncbi:MAG: S-layer homology domain-containing protein, partial [Gemmatimonadetes bacterium]|nr:S-layer homology domain-containing protein [Gemmatimonadota bacterium]
KLMFASLSRFRRLVAVLSALALMASVLAAAPLAAADDPEPDYPATFSACIGEAAEDAGFTDVPEVHKNAGDINCIAYYTITKGTGDGTTYSPGMSVTREHMALFLFRLAKVVGIDVASDPDDAGFTDIGDLGSESQTAINHLAELNITKGTGDGTTYSPADAVTRGQMALFIARLMDEMDPMADGDTAYGYTPDDVGGVKVIDTTNDNIADAPGEAKSPFTDLDLVTKEAYDAITALWELGVASGISTTSYVPEASIIRAHMAEFMAGVLDHSNARPAGVSMQVTQTTDFGEVEATRAISVRDDFFAPMADVSVKVFTATQADGFDEDTGKCNTDDICDWSDNGEITNDHGNNFEPIDHPTGTGNVEASETWYAWMGSEDNSEFVKGSSGEAMVTLTAKADALGIRVTTDIPKEATNNETAPNQVDVGKDKTVVVTAQLVDKASDADGFDDANPVAKEGVTLNIIRTRGTNQDRPGPAAMKTDADGKVTFTIMHVADYDEDDLTYARPDTVTFNGDVNDDPPVESNSVTVRWRNASAAVAEGIAKTDAGYAIIDDDKVRINVTVSYYDQYGAPAASGDTLKITVGATSGADGTFADSGDGGVRVRSNGIARYAAHIKATAGETKAVVVGALTGANTVPAPTVPAVLAVRRAHKNDNGESGDQTDSGSQVIVDADNDRFIIYGDGTVGGVLYSYDSNDRFIIDNNDVKGDTDKFEEAITTTGKTVEVVVYSPDPDGVSIFTVKDTG